MPNQVVKKPVSDVLAAIVNNEFTDNQIAQILNAIDFRKRHTARNLFSSVEIGDEVKIINTKLRPRYLVGLVCVVVGKGQKNLRVKPKIPLENKWDLGFSIDPEWLEPVVKE